MNLTYNFNIRETLWDECLNNNLRSQGQNEVSEMMTTEQASTLEDQNQQQVCEVKTQNNNNWWFQPNLYSKEESQKVFIIFFKNYMEIVSNKEVFFEMQEATLNQLKENLDRLFVLKEFKDFNLEPGLGGTTPKKNYGDLVTRINCLFNLSVSEMIKLEKEKNTIVINARNFINMCNIFFSGSKNQENTSLTYFYINNIREITKLVNKNSSSIKN